MQVSRLGREVDIACCRSVVKVAIPQRRGSELPIMAIRRSGVMSVPRQSLLVSASVRRTSRLIWSFAFPFLPQRHNWIRSGISHQAAHPIGPNFNADAIGFGKDSIADRRVCQANPRVSCDHQDPGFLVGIERPNRNRREIDPLKHKMRACNEDGSSGGEMSWGGLSLNRAGL